MKLHVYWLMSCQSQVIRQSLLLFNTSGLLQPRWQKKTNLSQGFRTGLYKPMDDVMVVLYCLWVVLKTMKQIHSCCLIEQ